MEEPQYALVELSVCQGELNALTELATFETLEEAKGYQKNNKLYRSGHPWNGLTDYEIVLIGESTDEFGYRPLSGTRRFASEYYHRSGLSVYKKTK
ncbi:MAG: hypothetical protein GY810_13000 [Aureispira sp.]|nr:hypothetical protein [Aureispira sp.]